MPTRPKRLPAESIHRHTKPSWSSWVPTNQLPTKCDAEFDQTTQSKRNALKMFPLALGAGVWLYVCMSPKRVLFSLVCQDCFGWFPMDFTWVIYSYAVRTKFGQIVRLGFCMILLDSQEVCTWILRVLQHLSCRLGTLNARLKAGGVLLDWLWNIWQAQRTDHDVCVVEFSKSHSFLTVWIDFNIKTKTLHKNKFEVFVFILVETDHSLFERHDPI